MSLFKQRKPRPFTHHYIYVDERKERLKKMEEQARRELGMSPEEKQTTDSLRGAFTKNSTHQRRRREQSRKTGWYMNYAVLILLIVVMLLLLNWLSTGRWLF